MLTLTPRTRVSRVGRGRIERLAGGQRVTTACGSIPLSHPDARRRRRGTRRHRRRVQARGTPFLGCSPRSIRRGAVAGNRTRVFGVALRDSSPELTPQARAGGGSGAAARLVYRYASFTLSIAPTKWPEPSSPFAKSET